MIKDQESSNLIIDKWVSAANMRSWISQKKKDVMPKMEKQVSDEIKEKKGVPIELEYQFTDDEK